jgi:hypothetical protein
MWACKEHTQYNVLSLLSFFSSDVVDLAVSIVLLSLRLWLVSKSWSRQLVGTLLSEVSIRTTLKARTQTLTSLVGCALGRLHYWAECWLWVLTRRWRYILPVHLLQCHCIWVLGLSIWSYGRCIWDWGHRICIDICNRFICGGLKNWLGYEKWGLTLLLEGCP